MRVQFIFSVLVALLLAACSKTAPPQEPVRAVRVMIVGQGQESSGYEYSGEVRARVESRLGFRVAGKVTKRMVELGQRVKSGQALAQLDAHDVQLSVNAARVRPPR